MHLWETFSIQTPAVQKIVCSSSPGLPTLHTFQKGQHYKMSWLWVAVSRNSRTIRRSDISPGGLTSQQMASPLLMIYLSERIHSGVSRGGEQLMEQSSGRPGAHLQSALPKKSPTYLKRPQHRPVTAHVKYCLLGKLTGD